MDRIDGFLSGKAQAVWSTALVIETEAGRWELRQGGATRPDVDLGDSFKAARMALYALIRAHHRQNTLGGSKG